MKNPPKAFITYAHKDFKKLKDFIEWLGVMSRGGEIVLVCDAYILPGENFREKIKTDLEDADVLLYLVSAASLASTACNDELSSAMFNAEKCTVPIPIILEDCDFPKHPLADFEALPTKDKTIKPISDWKPRSKGWQTVVDGLRKSIANLPVEQALLLFRRANFFSNILENYNAAISDYTKALELQPNFWQAYNNRGNAYYQQGDYAPALKDYSKAVELNPGFALGYNDRGNVYLAQRDYANAIANYSKAIELKLDFAAGAYNNRGTAYSHQGNFDRAITDFNKSIELQPDYAVAYYGRGAAKAASGDNKGAKEDLETAQKLAKQQGHEELAAEIREWINSNLS